MGKDVVKIACRFEKGFLGAVECLHDLATWITSHWKHQAAGNRAGPNSQQVYLAREALELQQRAGMISTMSQDFSARLSMVELTSRWVQWLDQGRVDNEEWRALCAEFRGIFVETADLRKQ